MSDGFAESFYYYQSWRMTWMTQSSSEVLLWCNMWRFASLLSSSLFTRRHPPLAKTFSLKGTWGLQGKIAVCSNPGWYLGHLISEQGLHLDPDRLYSVQSFPKPQTKHHLWHFLAIVGYAEIRFQISLLWPNLFVFYSRITTPAQFKRKNQRTWLLRP